MGQVKRNWTWVTIWPKAVDILVRSIFSCSRCYDMVNVREALRGYYSSEWLMFQRGEFRGMLMLTVTGPTPFYSISVLFFYDFKNRPPGWATIPKVPANMNCTKNHQNQNTNSMKASTMSKHQLHHWFLEVYIVLWGVFIPRNLHLLTFAEVFILSENLGHTIKNKWS